MGRVIVVLILWLGLVGATQASVVSGSVTLGTGSFVELDPTVPFAVGEDQQNTDSLYAFDEQQDFLLTRDLRVSGNAVISAGTRVASHFVFFDPLTWSHQAGSVTLSERVIGVLTSTWLLDWTDFLAAPTVDYRTPYLRGIENPDVVTFSGNTVYVDWIASTPGDYIRVLTEVAPVPLPGTAALMLGGLAGLAAMRRRRKAA